MNLTQEEKQIIVNLLLQATCQVQDAPRVIGIIQKLQVPTGDGDAAKPKEAKNS